MTDDWDRHLETPGEIDYGKVELDVLIRGFDEWLHEADYADSTIRQSLIDARRVIRLCVDDEPIHVRYWAVGRRLGRCIEERFSSTGDELLGPRWAELVSKASARTAERANRTRIREARSVDDVSWRKLYKLVVAEPLIEARVLEVMMITGLRVGDVFRMRRTKVRQALNEGVLIFVQKGGKERTYHLHEGPLRPALERLVGAWPASAATVLFAAAPSGKYGTAYNRVNRLYKKLADSLPGRAHTHRLRRTVAIHALRTTKDLKAVQQLLGHRSMMTTQKYVDEERPAEVAELQQEIHNKFLGEPDE